MSAASLRRPTWFQLVQEFSLPLIVGVVVALVWANVSPDSYHALLHATLLGQGHPVNFHFVINDIFMAIFFGVATKEITESCLPGGALNPPRKAVNPLFATLGGVVGPIAVYFGWVALTGDAAIRSGWGIPTATDIALAWLVARMAFGAHHPAVSFLLLLAVADDGLGLGIIAIFYPDPAHPVNPSYLLLILAAMAGAFALRKQGVRNFWFYLLGPGIVSWCGFHYGHLHPALALVPVVPFMPSMGHDEGLFAELQSGQKYDDTLNRFEHAFKIPVDFGLFFFGLANAGVQVSTVGGATWGVLSALALGKTLGIFSFSFVADKMGFSLPAGMDLRTLLITGMIAGLGLTVALFVAGVAFTDPTLQGAAKMGALLSAGLAPLAILSARALGIRRISHAHTDAAVAAAQYTLSRPPPAAGPGTRLSFHP